MVRTTTTTTTTETRQEHSDDAAPHLRRPVSAQDVSPASSRVPEPFASMLEGRSKRKLGDHFGLTNFGVNMTTLRPGAMSALKHQHTKQDEFIYILSGRPSLMYGDTIHQMEPGECFGFKCNSGVAHHLVNRSSTEEVTYLEIGDRAEDDQVSYPDDDLCAVSGAGGSWSFTHKDGTPYSVKE